MEKQVSVAYMVVQMLEELHVLIDTVLETNTAATLAYQKRGPKFACSPIV